MLMFIKTAFLLLAFLRTTFAKNECKQLDACRCRLNNGSEINLHRFDNNGSPEFRASHKGQSFTYSPCKGLNCGQGVRNSTVCMNDGKSNKSLGELPSFRFEFNTTKNIWTLKYSSQDNKTKSAVQLKCTVQAQFAVDPTSPTNVYEFSLSSPCVCPDGCLSVPVRTSMSPGTVLLLIFFSVLLVYFGVGSLYRKSVYGAEGRNIIPNNSFWFSLPGLIRDGYLFFISPCLGERVEYRYYDRL